MRTAWIQVIPLVDFVLLGSGIIFWSSRKKRTITDSSLRRVHRATRGITREVLLRQLLLEIGHRKLEHTTLYCDNNAASQLGEDQVWNSHAKYIRIKFHYIREQVVDDELKVTRIHTKDNAADVFTISLNRNDLERLRHLVSLHTSTRGEEE